MAAEPIIPAGLETDPEIQAALKTLALETIDAARDILDTAALPQRLQMIRILLPKMASGLAKPKDGEEDEEMRAQLDDIYSRFRKATGAPEE